MLEGRLYILGIPCDERRLANLVMAAILLATTGFHYERRREELPGPNPGIHQSRRGGYSFKGASSKSKRVDLRAFAALDASEAHNMILNSLPFNMRPRLSPHLSTALYYAEHYALDPFWILAVMWTESHFQTDVVSSANAKGLMQVMPDTAVHIGRILDKKMDRKLLLEYAKSPAGNIEFGIFYLSYLLEKFQGNHVLATVAYNMGPYWVLGRLRRGRPVGVKNLYLDKVNRAYKRLTGRYRHWAGGIPESLLAYNERREGAR